MLGALSPFLSSELPDGLERTAEDLNFINKENPMWQGIFPDYSFGDSTFGSIVAGMLGTIITAFIIGVIGFVLYRSHQNKTKG